MSIKRRFSFIFQTTQCAYEHSIHDMYLFNMPLQIYVSGVGSLTFDTLERPFLKMRTIDVSQQVPLGTEVPTTILAFKSRTGRRKTAVHGSNFFGTFTRWSYVFEMFTLWRNLFQAFTRGNNFFEMFTCGSNVFETFKRASRRNQSRIVRSKTVTRGSRMNWSGFTMLHKQMLIIRFLRLTVHLAVHALEHYRIEMTVNMIDILISPRTHKRTRWTI